MDNIREDISRRVLEQIDLSRDVSDEEILTLIRQEIIMLALEKGISIEERISIERDVFNSLRKLDVLQDLLEDEDITDEMTAVLIQRHI